MRRLFVTLFVVFSAFGVAPYAHGDIINTLIASGTFADSATLSGTLTLDATTGVFTAADLTVSAPVSLVFTFIQSQPCPDPAFGDCGVYIGTTATGYPTLDLGFDVSTFVGLNSALIVSVTDLFTPTPGHSYASDINYGLDSYEYLDSGKVVLGSQFDNGGGGTSSVTPEPSSFALFATGMLLITRIRRRQTA